MYEQSITIFKDLVIKKSHPDLMRIEVEKTQRAYKIGKECGLFQVPKVLDYDDSRGIATFERIYGIQNFCNVILSKREYEPLLESIGKSLAIIHDMLKLPVDMVWTLPNEFQLSGSEVFLHGDFNGANVCINQDDDSLVILDWQTTGVHGGKATYGTRYFDLIWFINYILWEPFHLLLFSIPITLISKIFIKSYFRTAEYIYNYDEISDYMRNFYRTKISLRKKNLTWKRRILSMPNRAIWRNLLASF